MSATLRLYVSADWPAHTTDCEWGLVDAKESLRQRGSSDPRHWPAAEDCEIVLSADQCLAVEARLPKGAKVRSRDLIAYAVEDRLIGEVEDEHFVAGETRRDGSTPVWVVGRARLRAVLNAMTQLGRRPRAAFSELQLVPLTAGRWSVGLRGRGGYVRTSHTGGFCFDSASAGPPLVLVLALREAREAGNAPDGIDIYQAAGVELDASGWHAALDIPVRLAGEYAWQDLSTRSARNLLSGEFAPRGERARIRATFKPALALGASALLLYSVFSVGEWIWFERQASSLKAQMVDVFRATFPQVQAIVDPALQMQRSYDQLKRERGQLGESDFLPLLATVSEALASQGRYRNMSYEEGRLELTITLPNALAARSLHDALARRGLVATWRESRVIADGIETFFSVRRGT